MADVNHKRKYKKECTVEVNVGDRRFITATMLINTLYEYVTSIYACVPKGSDCYDVTLPSVDEAKLLSEEEVIIDGQRLSFRLLFENTVVVSFMHLPPYIEDSKIEQYLTGKGAILKSEIKHRLIKDTDISDGTRYVRVQFDNNVKSLPYSVGFETMDGFKYFRVIHNNQMKVCFKCCSPDHELKSCPETKCYRCNGHGHVAKHCNMSVCDICGLNENVCDCHEDGYEISRENEDRYDMEFPSFPTARATEVSQDEEIDNTSETLDNETTSVEKNNDVKNKPKVRRNSNEWQSIISKRARRSLSVKISDTVLKDNEYKNKLRESRKGELKKRKDSQVNEKREINKDDQKTDHSTS